MCTPKVSEVMPLYSVGYCQGGLARVATMCWLLGFVFVAAQYSSHPLRAAILSSLSQDLLEMIESEAGNDLGTCKIMF